MQSVGLPTFQQTFAKCPFPEGVLAVLGSYPVEVRVVKADRAMEVRAVGPAISEEILAQAEHALAAAFRLNSAKILVDVPVVAEPESAVEIPTAEPLKEDKPEDIFAQMEAMRKQVMRAQNPDKGQKKSKVKQIYGKINNKKKPIPMCDLELDMGSVLVEGTVFNVEHKELTKRKAWVVCFDITDNTNSIRINKFMEGEEAKPIVAAVKVGQRLQALTQWVTPSVT